MAVEPIVGPCPIFQFLNARDVTRINNLKTDLVRTLYVWRDDSVDHNSVFYALLYKPEYGQCEGLVLVMP
jgi:hypothetical protein